MNPVLEIFNTEYKYYERMSMGINNFNWETFLKRWN